MSPDVFTPDVLDFCRALDAHGVRYLIIGGYAVHFHGHVRFTADIDFGYSPDVENAARLYAALGDFWGGTIPVVGSAEELACAGMVFQFGRKPNRIDLLSQVKGIDFETAWLRRVSVELDGIGVTIHVISLVDLRLAKQAAGRPKDLDDLANLPEP